MWGINTEYEIPYIDCLFNCMSAMTVCGLAVTNLSTLSPVQQTILFVQMIIGSPVCFMVRWQRQALNDRLWYPSS